MKTKSGGFTIIEIMIVLAIVGVLLSIIFLAVPALQRNARNYQQKVAVQAVYSAMHEYYNTHGHYPLTGSGLCSDVPECANFRDNEAAKGNSAQNYTIDYADNDRRHSWPYSTPSGKLPANAGNTVVIFPAHRCQRDVDANPPGSTDYPVYTTDAADNDFRRFAVYTFLENGLAYCVDDIN